MAISAINLARVSFNQRTTNLLEALRSNHLALYQQQTRIATGLAFLRPSEDPVRSASAVVLERRIDWMNQVKGNLDQVNATVSEIDSAMQEALAIFSESQALAVQVVGDTLSEDERQALVTVADGLLDRMFSIANRRYLNTWLFGGQSGTQPFTWHGTGVLYQGDDQRLETMVDSNLTADFFTVPGTEFFRALSSEVRGAVDLNPAVRLHTRLSDLNGALGRGVTPGRIAVATAAGNHEIDLREATTAGQVVDRLNADFPAGLRAELTPVGIRLVRDRVELGEVTITDVGGGSLAGDLGLAGAFDQPIRNAVDLDPRLTLQTRISDLRAGAGLQLDAPLSVRNGPDVVTIGLREAQTIQDVLNLFNESGAGVWARINDDGRTLNVQNRVSGTALYIEEAGGQTATRLGLRSLHGGTRLAEINGGGGVGTGPGHDLRITTADGTNVLVDLSGTLTLDDVITRLNHAAGGAVTAALAQNGNGLQLTDHTAGAGTLTLTSPNNTSVIRDLGLDEPPVGNRITGRDVHPHRVDSPFTALLELRAGMLANDRLGMQAAAARLERVMQGMQRVQGQMASQARSLADRSERIETELSATQILLSDVRDTDIADAAVRFSQLQTALQASMQTSAQMLNLSLLDYLR